MIWRCPTLWVSIIAGVRTDGSLASSVMVVSGREFTIAHTSARNVESMSWVKPFTPFRRSIQSKIQQVTPIMRSQAPPKWEACGGLNIHAHSLLCRYLCTKGFSTNWWTICSSFTAPTKLVPLSERNCRTGPRIDRKRLNALMKQEVLNSSTSWIWIPLDIKHVNRNANHLLVANPPCVRLAVTSQGTKVTTPTNVNRGPGFKRSFGMLAIFCLQNDARNLRHATQWWISEAISRLAPIF